MTAQNIDNVRKRLIRTMSTKSIDARAGWKYLVEGYDPHKGIKTATFGILVFSKWEGIYIWESRRFREAKVDPKTGKLTDKHQLGERPTDL